MPNLDILKRDLIPKKTKNADQGSCAIDCPYCQRNSAEKTDDETVWSCYRDLIQKAGADLLHVRLYENGNLLHRPRVLEMIKHARAKHIHTKFYTNAHNLNNGQLQQLADSGLSEFCLLFDGATREALEQYKAGQPYKKEKATVLRLCRARCKSDTPFPEISLHFVVRSHNEHEIPAIRTFSEQAGADSFYVHCPEAFSTSDSFCESIDAEGNQQNPRLEIVMDKSGTVSLRKTFKSVPCWTKGA
ncbi:MAG: radical SAM protein [Chitinispirillaceae bacterium]